MAEIKLLAQPGYPERRLHLTYCTNVHPGQSLEEMIGYLQNDTAQIKQAIFPDRPMALGLRIGTQQAEELLGIPAPTVNVEQVLLDDAVYGLAPGAKLEAFGAELKRLGHYLWAVNAFPIQDFHAPRVKEEVYQPDWTLPARAASTVWIARVLVALLGDRPAGSLSVPTGVFKGIPNATDQTAICAEILGLTAAALEKLRRVTGKTVRVGLEPEPFTTAETIPEFISYYQDQLLPAGTARLVREFGLTREAADTAFRNLIGINFDLCHQAIEFEDIPAGLRQLKAAGIRVLGVHVSSALAVDDFSQPATAVEYLRHFNEPRYLHQVIGRREGMAPLLHWPDLPEFFKFPAAFLAEISEIRVHFHIPIFCEKVGPLKTTQSAIVPALTQAAAEGLCDTWMIETYTWNLLLKKGNSAIIQSTVKSVADGIIEEFQWLKQQMPWE